MATSLGWYDASSVALSGSQAISGLPTTPGTPVVIQVINWKDASSGDPMVSARLVALFRNVGDNDYKTAGTEWADNHYIEVRIDANGWNNTLVESDWVKLGKGRSLPLPDLVYDQGIKFSVRLNIPASVIADEEEFTLRVDDSPSTALSAGFTETMGPGIVVPVQDGRGTEIVVGSDVTEDSPQSRDVKILDTVWIAAGKVYTAVAQDVTIPNAATDLERYDLVSLDAAGSATITRTAGTEVTTGTITDADKPAVPAGDIELAYVFAEDSGAQTNIATADIENVWGLSFYEFDSTTLTAHISRGPHCVIDNMLTYNSAALDATLTASTTNYVWMLSNGQLSVTTTLVPPDDRALLLWEATTDGSGVTATVDHRSFTGGRIIPITFRWDGTTSTADYRYATLPSFRDGWILPIGGIVASFGTQAVGGTAGATIWDIEVNYASSTWTTLFGTGSTKPQIAYNAAAPDMVDVAALATRWDVTRLKGIRANITTVPTSTTTNPKDATLTVLVVG